jgi:hypothetical protein
MKDIERENVSLVLARLLDAYERRERLAVTANPDGSVTFRPLEKEPSDRRKSGLLSNGSEDYDSGNDAGIRFVGYSK